MATSAWISLGSNLGDRRAILDDALVALAETQGVAVRDVSSYHETRPVGGPTGQGPFLNAAAWLETDLSPHELLAALQRIENRAGRVRTVRWGERTLDLDLLIYGTKFLDTRELKLPHPRLAFRRFVLGPLAEIAPTIMDTMTMRTVDDLLTNLDREPRLVAVVGLDKSLKKAVFGRLIEELPGLGVSKADLGSERPGLECDPIRAIREGPERAALESSGLRWMAETLRVPWVVADYHHLELWHAPTKSLWPYRSRDSYEADAQWKSQVGWMIGVQVLAGTALPPTFVVALPGRSTGARRPGLGSTPRLWPESDEPHAIVAEVLETCRGIDGL